MISWIVARTGLSAIVVKLILCAAVSGGIFYALHWYGNVQWYKGEQKGRESATSELEKVKKAEWAAKADAMAADAAQLAAAFAAAQPTPPSLTLPPDFAEQVAAALIWGQHPAGGWNYVVDFAGERSLRDWYDTVGKNAWRLEEFQHYYGNATFDDAGFDEDYLGGLGE